MTLNDLKIGSESTITAVRGEGALRLRLLDMGLIPGTRVKVIKIAPLGDPIEITLRGYELTIRREHAKEIDISEEGTNLWYLHLSEIKTAVKPHFLTHLPVLISTWEIFPE